MMELDSLLEPISEDQPSGEDLRDLPGDLTFETLKDMRTELDPELDESGEGREADWRGVARLCDEVLRERSKDLEVLVCLVEAQTGLEGLAGLEQGLVLLRRSLEGFWETLHPGVDEEEGEIALPLRARWLSWLGSATGFLPVVKKSPIATGGGVALSWADYENSMRVDDATISPERRQELIEAGYITAAQWQAAVGSSSPESLQELVRSIESSEEELRAIEAFVAERFAAQDEEEELPSLTRLTNFLSELREYLESHGGSGGAAEASEEGGTEIATAGAAGSAAGRGPLASRQDALRQLQEVGDYFRRTEPHSPISYLVARAVRWGGMSLEDLLKDVVRTDEVIEHIWETLGLDRRSGGDDEGEQGEEEY